MAAVLDIESAIPPRMVAAAVDGAANASAAALPIPEQYLDGGEVVLLAVKPSPWFVLFDAARWIAAAAVFVVFSNATTLRLGGMSDQTVTQVAAVMIAGRVGVAFLRWASRFYVLTNRRVMRLRGVFRPDVLAAPLVTVRNTRVDRRPHERLCKLGTIQFFFEKTPPADLNWREIARCEQVHEQVRRAIERALDSQPHL